MNRRSDIDEKAVQDRLASGQVPILDASYSLKSIYADGAEVSHQVMSRIAHAQLMHAPRARGQSWVLQVQLTTESPS